MASIVIDNDYITIPKVQYVILKNIYDLNKKQLDLSRMYEVEENIKNGNYKTSMIDDFINSI